MSMSGKSVVFFLLLYFMFPAGVSGQDSLAGMNKRSRVEADYIEGTLTDIAGKPSKGGGPQPFRVQAIFTGKIRTMTPERKKVLADWANAFAGNPDQYIQNYQSEIAFLDGKTEFWLGIRKKDLQISESILIASPRFAMEFSKYFQQRDCFASLAMTW